jgi:hypothetical protein
MNSKIKAVRAVLHLCYTLNIFNSSSAVSEPYGLPCLVYICYGETRGIKTGFNPRA